MRFIYLMLSTSLLLGMAGCVEEMPQLHSPDTNCPLTSPYVIHASDGGATDSIQITWEEVLFASNYNVYRSESKDGTYALRTAQVTDTSFIDQGIQESTIYYYKVTANEPGCTETGLNTAYDSGFASSDCPESAPENIAASDGAYPDKVRITWSAVSYAGMYSVYRSDAEEGTFSSIGTSVTTSFDDTSVTDSTVYYYKVSAGKTGCDETNQSEYAVSGSSSNSCPETAPTGVAATNGSFEDKIYISWTGVANVSEYEVYRSESESGTYELVGATIGNSFNDTSVAQDVTYYYKVKGLKAGCSDTAWSGVDDGVAEVDATEPSLNFTNFQVAIEMGDSGTGLDTYEISNPCVIYDDSKYKMYYHENDGYETRIIYTESLDGINWENFQVTLPTGASGTGYDDLYVYAPTIIKDDLIYKIWYTGCKRYSWNHRILYAESADGINWENFQIAIDINESGLGLDMDHCRLPNLIKDGSLFRIWYNGDDPVRILYADSENGKTFTNFQLQLDLSASTLGFDNIQLVSPSVIKDDSDYKMIYQGKGDDNKHRLIYAESIDGYSWSNFQLVVDVGASGEFYDQDAVSTPWLMKINGKYKLWYRAVDNTGATRIIYAETE